MFYKQSRKKLEKPAQTLWDRIKMAEIRRLVEDCRLRGETRLRGNGAEELFIELGLLQTRIETGVATEVLLGIIKGLDPFYEHAFTNWLREFFFRIEPYREYVLKQMARVILLGTRKTPDFWAPRLSADYLAGLPLFHLLLDLCQQIKSLSLWTDEELARWIDEYYQNDREQFQSIDRELLPAMLEIPEQRFPFLDKIFKDTINLNLLKFGQAMPTSIMESIPTQNRYLDGPFYEFFDREPGWLFYPEVQSKEALFTSQAPLLQGKAQLKDLYHHPLMVVLLQIMRFESIEREMGNDHLDIREDGGVWFYGVYLGLLEEMIPSYFNFIGWQVAPPVPDKQYTVMQLLDYLAEQGLAEKKALPRGNQREWCFSTASEEQMYQSETKYLMHGRSRRLDRNIKEFFNYCRTREDK